MSIETTIQDLTRRWLKGATDNDIEAIMALYHPAVRSFDAILAIQVLGEKAYRAHWKECMASCPGEPIFEMHDLVVDASDSLAVSHCLTHCGATGEGEEQGGWMRCTHVWKRDGDQWKITHEHFSCPFNPQDMSLIMTWQPEHTPVPFN